MKHLIICGTGDFSRELYWHALSSIGYNIDWNIKGFLAWNESDVSDEDRGKLPLSIVGDINSYVMEEGDVFTCAIGNPHKRKDFIEKILEKKGEFINIIHKTSIIQGNTQLGTGVILCPYTLINDNAQIEDYVMINSMSTVGHDVHIGKYSCLMGHVDLCGYANIGDEVYFGSGSRVLPKGKVESNSYVGAGSVVLKKVKTGTTVFGVPAQRIDL